MNWLKWELEMPQVYQLRLRLETNLFSISSTITPNNNSYHIYEKILLPCLLLLSFTEQLQLLKSGSNAELKAIMLMPKTIHMKLKYTKCVCSAFKYLHQINLILTFMFPIESETLYDSIQVLISLNNIFLFVSLTYRL